MNFNHRQLYTLCAKKLVLQFHAFDHAAERGQEFFVGGRGGHGGIYKLVFAAVYTTQDGNDIILNFKEYMSGTETINGTFTKGLTARLPLKPPKNIIIAL